MAKEDRGFASMDRAKQREIASKGGKAAIRKERRTSGRAKRRGMQVAKAASPAIAAGASRSGIREPRTKRGHRGWPNPLA